MSPVARVEGNDPGFDAIKEGQFVGLIRFDPEVPAAMPFQGLPSLVPAAALQRFGKGKKFNIFCPIASDEESKAERYWFIFIKLGLLGFGVKYAPVVGFRAEFAMIWPFELV
jgi:hypothetical protein